MVSLGKIAVSGAKGFIGSRLCERLTAAGYEIWPLVRQKPRHEREIFYDYDERLIEIDKLTQCSAVIHLAGRNLFDSLWTSSFKKELYDSRVKSTRFIAQTLAKLEGPKTLLNASAIGIYGDRGNDMLDESSSPSSGFLAQLCVDWERATLAAKDAGLRVVNMRFGPVLGKGGGMLSKMIPFFKMGLGGYIGLGNEYLSWVSCEQLVAMIMYLLENPTIAGPVNMVSPHPTTAKVFAQTLAQVLDRNPPKSLPRWFIKPLGEQATALITSARVSPRVLAQHGFPFNPQEDLPSILATAVSSERT